MRAVIFDMDGVLVDSEPLWRLAERQIFAEVGLELSDADCERTMGMRTDEVIEHWYRISPWEGATCAEVEARLEGRMRELITERATAMPGVEESIAMVRAEGLALGLATSSAPALIDTVLSKLGLGDAFAITHSAIEEELGKPHPAVFLTTAICSGSSLTSASLSRTRWPASAQPGPPGMRVIAVPPAHLFDEAGYEEADIKLGSLENSHPRW